MRETDSMRASPAETHNANREILGLERRFVGAESGDEGHDGVVAGEVLEREGDAVECDADGEEGFHEDGTQPSGGGLECVQYGDHGGAHLSALFDQYQWVGWHGGAGEEEGGGCSVPFMKSGMRTRN